MLARNHEFRVMVAVKDRKFYRVVATRRESERPRILAPIPETREVRFWPKAVVGGSGIKAN